MAFCRGLQKSGVVDGMAGHTLMAQAAKAREPKFRRLPSIKSGLGFASPHKCSGGAGQKNPDYAEPMTATLAYDRISCLLVI